ncbi:MAG: sulfotransferase family protein [Pseudomonadota bacterium]|nr:sulfotransferase family protein [Pseudomonadota bacterium]MDQ2803298.1 sulfotransferase family protein [Pseudomonadota bacterium]
MPKTAGTALRVALTQAYGPELRVFADTDGRRFEGLNPDDYDLYSGHFGYRTALALDGDMITVFRNPVDRFISVYFFWRQLYDKGVERSRNTTLAMRYSLDEFVAIRDEPFLIEEFFNRATWQIAYGSMLQQRHEIRDQGKSEDEVFRMASTHLQDFALIGVQERLREFADQLRQKFGVDLAINRINVTEAKLDKADIRIRTLKTIHEWTYMDLELYQRVLEAT